MRLLRLDLERYGPFTGRSIAFRPGARLHVVLGPNEAGKSTALAAVGDLLFGAKDSRVDFLRPEAGLGATIEARDGRMLAFTRRRGRRNTLGEPGGKTLPDDALSPFLGGLTREVFTNAFGLDASSLREGGVEMLRSEGEIGKTLFAAASGLRGIRDAAATLDREASEIFTPNARTRRLNVLRTAYDEARKAAAAERIGTDRWKAVETGLSDVASRLQALAEERRANAEEASRLRRLRAAAPVLAVLDETARALGDFADLPPMDAASRDALSRAARQAEASRERLDAAETALARAEADVGDIRLDAEVQPLLDAIEALAPQGGAYAKAVQDLPRIQAELDAREAALATLASRLGLAGGRELEDRQPSDAARVELRSLIAEGSEIDGGRARLAAATDRLRKDRAALERARAADPLVDPGPHRLAHEALRPVLGEIARRDALRADIRQAEAEMGRELARLRPAPGLTMAAIASALPDGETVAAAGEVIADAARRVEALRESRAAAESETASVEARMAARSAVGEVPDPSELPRLREARDTAFAAIRAALAVRPSAAHPPETTAFERAQAAADLLADRLIADAQRAADQASDGRRVGDLRREAARLEARIAEAETVLRGGRTAWAALWQPLALAPSGPAAMAEWRSRAAALVAQDDALAARRIDAAAIEQRIEGIRPLLETVAERLGLAPMPGLDLALLDEHVSERLKAMTAPWETARESAGRLAAMAASLEEAEGELAELSTRHRGWLGRWRAGLAACALAAGTTPEGAAAALDAWSEVPALLRERDDRHRRVAGMRRDIGPYETEVRRLAAALAMGGDAAIAESARRLAERANAARDAAVASGQRMRMRDAARRTRDEHREAAREVAEALATLASRHGLAGADDLAAVLARLGERARLTDRIEVARAELARAGEGAAEAELRSGLAGMHVDRIEARLGDLAAEGERLEQDGRVAYAEREGLRADRRRMEGGVGAEAAMARKGAAETQIREAARRYVVLKLGSLLLDAAVERHRAGHQDPLVARAGALFSGLTGGAYQGLGEVFDERDEATLAGRRTDGRGLVGVTHMSEGTRDQLFLALRLAYLEDYAARAEPAPFLGDDVFASFDDRRTAFGLEALGTIGGSVQPILFTHHESVARQAERCLGAEVDVVELA